jgi:CheY-like chemotaxis protein
MLCRLSGERIQIVYDLDEHLPPVLIDPTMAEQVAYNLVVNARDAMPDGGKIFVRTLAVDDRNVARLEVEDTGVGMDDKTKAKIFEPFFTTKAMGKGTGLGLATVYGVVQQTNGTIAVESLLGRGTLFRIDLPRSPSKSNCQEIEAKNHSNAEESIPSASKESKADDAMTKGKKLETILLVEDEDGLRLLARRVLEMKGYRVLTAADAKDALEIHGSYEGRIDLLITDVVMPETTGVQLVERLLPTVPDMKVIFMSGYTDDEVIHQGVMMEEVHFLQKPFSPPNLLEKVRSVLQATLSPANSAC